MSKVKTYAVNCNDAWLNTDGDDISGSYVKYKDHQEVVAALDAKCAALAAENAGLKSGAIKAIEDIQCFYDSEAWHVSEDGESETAVVALDDAKGSVEHFVLNVKTPATDAFLAEVRAQGVEMFAECAYTLEHHDHAVAFAAELRKGGGQK